MPSQLLSHAGSRRLVSVLVALLLGGIVVAIGLRSVSRLNGNFGAKDYPRVRQSLGTNLDFMPATLPPNATHVAISAKHLGFNMIPSPDRRVTVSFRLPTEDATALLRSAQEASLALKSRIGDEKYNMLAGSDNLSESRVLLANPHGINSGGVTVDAGMGIVEYWYQEM
jgi:hypothetical protein